MKFLLRGVSPPEAEAEFSSSSSRPGKASTATASCSRMRRVSRRGGCSRSDWESNFWPLGTWSTRTTLEQQDKGCSTRTTLEQQDNGCSTRTTLEQHDKGCSMRTTLEQGVCHDHWAQVQGRMERVVVFCTQDVPVGAFVSVSGTGVGV